MGFNIWLFISTIRNCKILIVIILSYIIITKYRRGIRNIIDIFTCFLHIVPILALIFLQPDLGTTMIIVFSYLCILFLCEANIKPLVYIGIFAIISAYPVYTCANRLSKNKNRCIC